MASVAKVLLVVVLLSGSIEAKLIEYDEKHLKEDLKEYMDDGNDVNDWDLDSEEDSSYHFFKLHDYDKNNKLDGLEIAASFSHRHPQAYRHETEENSAAFDDEQIMSLIDNVMEVLDVDDNGYIDYLEYKSGMTGARDTPESSP